MPLDVEAVLAETRRAAAQDRERHAMWQEGYAHGQADGYAQGVREAEDDMAAHWKTVGDRIRADIDKTPYVSWFNVAYVRALPVPADIGPSAQRPVYEYGKAA